MGYTHFDKLSAENGYYIGAHGSESVVIDSSKNITSGNIAVPTGKTLSVADDGALTVNSVKVSTVKQATARIAAVAAGSTGEWAVFKAPEACEITAAYIVPDSAITGADTNYMTLSIVDKGSDGTGTTAIASVDFTSGTDAAAFDAFSLGTLGDAKTLAAGDVVSFKKAEAGTGMDMPNLLVVIEYKKV